MLKVGIFLKDKVTKIKDFKPMNYKKIFLVLFFLVELTATYAQNSNIARNLIIPKATVKSNSATLLWDKPIDYKNILKYIVYQNGKEIGTCTKTNFTTQNLSPNKEYSFYIKSQNKEGKLSESSKKIHCKTKLTGQVFNILDFGAKGDGITKNTIAIQKTINACTIGGTVLIPSGIFLSGALYLKSDMTLFIEEGGTLKGSLEVEDYYPLILNRFEGWEMKTTASLLNAGTLNRDEIYTIKNLSIEGKGTISGGSSELGDAIVKLHGLRGRGRLICIMNGQNINIQGLTIENSPCWTIHYIYSNQVVLHDLKINSTAHNGDGIDPDSSTDSYIFNCTFSTGDDCIAIKSGKNPEGFFVAKPTRNIRITDCDFKRGHSLAIGSEMSGGVSDISIQDCKIGNLDYGLQIKTTKDRGGYVKNVTVSDCELQKITLYTSLYYNNDGESAPKLPLFSDMKFLNLNLTASKPNQILLDINGFSDPNHYTKNILFENLLLPKDSKIKLKNAENLTFKNVQCTDGKKPEYQITESKNVNY